MKTHDYYTEKISSLKANTVENILNIGLIMKEAKSNLSKIDFEKFIEKAHYSEKSSSVRKWTKIGEAYQRLSPIADQLPVVWSTIYKLSALPIEKFDRLERLKILSPTITAREIDENIKVKNPVNLNKIQITLKFDLNISPDAFKKIHNLVVNSIPNSICQLKMTKKAEAMLDAANSCASFIKLAA